MIESHLKAGNQKLAAPDQLEYGKSITDACVSFETTERMLLDFAQSIAKRSKVSK
jgi:3-deoxy-7-phosphoheptulonate synthase